MPSLLHLLLLALVLIGLGFVQATGIVSAQAMLPLWLSTLASPWLRRLQRFWPWRLAWNAAVLLVFTLLVRHAATTGLLFLLEDGLLLTALCQVHLLNNVGERQRPDLLFFNSVLIAFVTSLFAADLSWCVLFVLHGAVLVPALQVAVFARRGAPAVRAAAGALLRDGLQRAVAVGAVAAAAFLLLPRDFHRQGWLGDLGGVGAAHEAGLADRIRLGDERHVALGDMVVLRVAPASGRPEDVPAHWRGIAFATFETNTWTKQDARQLGSRFATDPAWTGGPGNVWRRPSAAAGGPLHVRQFDLATGQLLLPLGACELRLDAAAGLLLDPRSSGGFGVLRLDGSAGPVAHTLRVAAGPGRVPVSARALAVLLQLPDAVPPALRALAGELRGQLPQGAGPAATAAHAADFLRRHRRYQLPGGPGFARNLEEFVLGTAPGHCEYFATTLALLLRLQGTPCRVVGGYLAQEWDPDGASMVARARDAHAWVEVLLPDGAWCTVDPTPPADAGAQAAATGAWDRARAALQRLWAAVVGFDAQQRAALLGDLGALPGRALAALVRHAWLAGTALAVVLLLLLRRARRRQCLPEVVDLRRAARAAGLALRPGETVRELLARADPAAITEQHFAALAAAAERHEAARYARGPLAR